MRIDVSDVYSSDHKIKEENITVDIEDLEALRGDYDVESISPIAFRFENIGTRKIHLKSSFRISLSLSCDRCLAEVKSDLDIDYEIELIRDEEEIRDEEGELVSFADGNELDIVEFVKICVLMNMPSKILCREDCKGLCPVCGNNLNLKDCGCDSFVPDPRMARIADIFNASNKEV